MNIPNAYSRAHALLILALAGSALLLATCSGSGSSGGVREVAPAAFTSPARITGTDGTTLWVTDPGSSSVCGVDRTTLALISCFTIEGTPLGIAWSSGRLYIGNETTQAIEVYDQTGSKLSTFAGTFTSPTSLAIDDQNGLLFVLDSSAKTVEVLTLWGYQLLTIGSGQLLYPAAMTVDTVRQEVLVSDYGNIFASFGSDPGWIRIYTYTGTFVAAIEGSTSGFSRPQGLYVAGDQIFLTDAWRGRVLIMTRQTSTLTTVAGSLGSFGDQPGQLMLPLDTVVAPDSGDVFVTNNRPGRIERFAGGGLLP